MARINQTLGAISALVARRFAKRTVSADGLVGNTVNAPQIPGAWDADNGYEDRWVNAAGTDHVRALSVNGYDQVMVAEALATAERKTVTWEVIDNASISSAGFFLVNPTERYRVTKITWVHATQSSVSGTAYIEKTPSGTAIGSGTSLMSGTFNLHTIANNTVTSATLSTTNTGDSDNPDLILNPGDQLSVVIGGTITSLVGVQVTVTLAPLGQSVKTATFYLKANADLVQNQAFFGANRPLIITGVSMRWSTLSSVSGLKATVTNDPSATAPGGGTSVLTDNSNLGPLVTQAANTTYAGTLSTTAATVRVLNGSYLSLSFSGATLTALVGMVVTVSFIETAASRVEKTFFLDHVVGASTLVGIAAACVWTADRDYEIIDLSEVHRVAGTDGGAVTIGVAIATGTTAPGSATIIQTDTSNAGFSIKSTAATPLFGTLAALNKRFLLTGDRLCVVPAGTFTTAAGCAITVSLMPR